MTDFSKKILLFIGGSSITNQKVILHFLRKGVQQLRILSGDEEGMVKLRDTLSKEHLSDVARVKYYIGDIDEPAYMTETMAGVDQVLYIPTIPRAFDCEVAPAANTITFLETVTGVIHNATNCGVKKTIVVSPARQETLTDMPAMLAAMIETVVVAEARYLGPESASIICCARMGGGDTTLSGFVTSALAIAKNGDLFIQGKEGSVCKPCENFEMTRMVES